MTTSPQSTDSGLAHVPVALFSAVMGISGLSLAWRRAAQVWGVPELVGQALFAVAGVVFVVLAATYALKWIRYPEAVQAEWRHPVQMSFVPTVTISLLLLATAGQDLIRPFAIGLWWIGALGHLALTVAVLSAWFGRADITLGQVTPAWLIPIVGNVVTPLAVPGIGSIDLAWFAFSVGLIFWLALLPLLLQRVLLNEAPIPDKLLPTLAIFMAPPAVTMLSWQSLTGSLDDPAGRILHSAAVMFALLLLAQVTRLRTVPFAVPYWAYSFPLAALTAASIAMAAALNSSAYDVLAIALLALTTLLVAVVGFLSLRAVARGTLFVPD